MIKSNSPHSSPTAGVNPIAGERTSTGMMDVIPTELRRAAFGEYSVPRQATPQASELGPDNNPQSPTKRNSQELTRELESLQSRARFLEYEYSMLMLLPGGGGLALAMGVPAMALMFYFAEGNSYAINSGSLFWMPLVGIGMMFLGDRFMGGRELRVAAKENEKLQLKLLSELSELQNLKKS